MARKRLLTADPVEKVISQRTGEVVGLVYRWNTGKILLAWFAEEVKEVRFEPILRPDGSEA